MIPTCTLQRDFLTDCHWRHATIWGICLTTTKSPKLRPTLKPNNLPAAWDDLSEKVSQLRKDVLLQVTTKAKDIIVSAWSDHKFEAILGGVVILGFPVAFYYTRPDSLSPSDLIGSRLEGDYHTGRGKGEVGTVTLRRSRQ